jgi:hypothetical protein
MEKFKAENHNKNQYFSKGYKNYKIGSTFSMHIQPRVLPAAMDVLFSQ